MESIFQKVFSNASRHGPACAQQRAASISLLTPTTVSRLTVVRPLCSPCFCAHWLDDVIFTKILDCRSGSDEVRPGVSRRNLNAPLFVLHITMNKGCTPAPRGKQIRSHASLSSFLTCLIVATMLNQSDESRLHPWAYVPAFGCLCTILSVASGPGTVYRSLNVVKRIQQDVSA